MKKILLFDGECGLCSKIIQFLLKWEIDESIKYVSIQSDLGKKYLSDIYIYKDREILDTVIFIKDNTTYFQSDAVIEICKYIRYPYQAGKLLIFIPRTIRNYGYDFIAKYRNYFFRKNDTCTIAEKNINERIIQ